MASVRETIVDPDGTGDYLNWDAWEDDFGGVADSGDCVGQDEIARANLQCTGGSADTTAMTVSGWTSTSADCYPELTATLEDGFRHANVWPTSGNIYRNHSVGGNPAADIREEYTKIRGVAAHTQNVTAGNGCFELNAAWVVCDSCLVYAQGSNNSGKSGFRSEVSSVSPVYVYLINCHVYDFPGGRGYLEGTMSNAYAVYYQCQAVETGYAFYSNNGHLANCLAFNTTYTAYAITGGTVRNCAYDKGSDPGTGGVNLSGVAAADLFVAPATEDYSLLETQYNPLFRNGADLSNDIYYSVTVDYKGDPYSYWNAGNTRIYELVDSNREKLQHPISVWSLAGLFTQSSLPWPLQRNPR